MPKLRKIKRGAMPTHLPTQIAPHLILPQRPDPPPTPRRSAICRASVPTMFNCLAVEFKSRFEMNRTLASLVVFLALALICKAQQPVFQWAEQPSNMNGLGGGSGFSVCSDSEGNVITAGVFDGYVDFDPGPDIFYLTSFGGMDIYIQKLDRDGNLIWVKQIGGISRDGGGREGPPAATIIYNYGLTVNVDNQDNVIITGSYNVKNRLPSENNTVDFDPNEGVYNLVGKGESNLFALKLNAHGNFLWAKSIGDYSSYVFANASAIATDGSIYVTGRFSGVVDFNPAVPDTQVFRSSRYWNISIDYSDIFALKIDKNGNFLWAKQFPAINPGSSGYHRNGGSRIGVDSVGDIVITGCFTDTVDFDPGPRDHILISEIFYTNLFILKLSSYGSFKWVRQLSTGGSIPHLSSATDAGGNIFIFSSFNNRSTIDFDPGLGVHQISKPFSSSLFILKLNSSGEFVWVKSIGGGVQTIEIDVYTNTDGNIYLLGLFYGDVGLDSDFDPGPNVFPLGPRLEDLFVVKLDSLGNFRWVTATEARAFSGFWPNSISEQQGNIYVTGNFHGTVDINPGPDTTLFYAYGPTDVFILALHDDFSTSDNNVQSDDSKIIIYPNPSNGKFSIALQHSVQNLKICLYSMTGQLLCTRTSSHNKIIPIELLCDPGIYVLCITDANRKTKNFKLIMQ